MNYSQKGLKIYLAARYERREELKKYVNQLQQLDYEITARWLNSDHDVCDNNTKNMLQKSIWALEDKQDIVKSDLFLCFTDTEGGSGGRHVEFGIALAERKEIIVIGPRENIFHCLEYPFISAVFERWEQFYEEANICKPLITSGNE